MYSRFAEMEGYKIDVVKKTQAIMVVIRKSVFRSGTGAFSKLKYENGAHRVQRVPETESR